MLILTPEVKVALPSIGSIVHYVSYGTPGGEYRSECRAAIITGIIEAGEYLTVFNPTGMFFNRCENDEENKKGGTWHWPECS
jgi:hypothetical protein